VNDGTSEGEDAMPRSRRARPVVALTAAAVLVAAGGCAGPAAQDLPGCVILDNLREQAVGQVTSELGGPYPSIGDSSTYVHSLYGADGAAVATVYGKTNVRLRMADGGLLEYVDEQIRFGDGTVQSQGYYEVGAAAGAQGQFLPMIGADGVFRDKLGRRTFRPLTAGQTATTTVKLCPAGMLK
jgi:hypothetical protein